MRHFLSFSLIFICLLAGAQNPKREFRAVWIATVKNIDWPTRPGLTTRQQKEEYRRMLDFHQMNGMNAVIMQVRPSADAFYANGIESWSRYLTGESGLAPDPYYDPLTFMIDEAHDRGMEFHAWFNPYRAIVDLEEMPEDSTHIFYERPEWFVQYGDRMYFDPAIPEVQDYTVGVIADVVERYDIDAVHFDDYFYPYRIAGLEFPDSLSFAAHGGAYTLATKDDWRRENVNTIIKSLNDTIKAVKPWVKFGISPFGVWRNIADDPRGSDSEAGQTNYDDLFADVLKWMDEGWIDYILPQLYLHRDHPKLSYTKVLKWWDALDYMGHLYVGHAIYRVGSEREDGAWMNPEELPEQIKISRALPNVLGGAYFSSKSFFQNKLGITDRLRGDFYRTPALVPTMPWLDSIAPATPTELMVKNDPSGVFVSWSNTDSTTRNYVLYRFEGKKIGDFSDPENILQVIPSSSPFWLDKTARKRKKYTYAVAALDRMSNESEPTHVRFIKVKRPK